MPCTLVITQNHYELSAYSGAIECSVNLNVPFTSEAWFLLWHINKINPQKDFVSYSLWVIFLLQYWLKTSHFGESMEESIKSQQFYRESKVILLKKIMSLGQKKSTQTWRKLVMNKQRGQRKLMFLIYLKVPGSTIKSEFMQYTEGPLGDWRQVKNV